MRDPTRKPPIFAIWVAFFSRRRRCDIVADRGAAGTRASSPTISPIATCPLNLIIAAWGGSRTSATRRCSIPAGNRRRCSGAYWRSIRSDRPGRCSIRSFNICSPIARVCRLATTSVTTCTAAATSCAFMNARSCRILRRGDRPRPTTPTRIHLARLWPKQARRTT